MSPRPSTRVPFVQTATVRPIHVKRLACDGSASIVRHTRATPGT